MKPAQTDDRPPASSARRAVRLVAYLEALKGIVVLAVASGVLSLVHKDIHAFAARLVEHAHLNPASRYPSIFLDAASNLQDSRLLYLAAGAAAYAGLRFVEAYGLYRDRAWAEWLAAASGGIYLPIEAVNFARHQTVLGAAVFLVNLVVVGIIVLALVRRRQHRASTAAWR